MSGKGCGYRKGRVGKLMNRLSDVKKWPQAEGHSDTANRCVCGEKRARDRETEIREIKSRYEK